MQNSDGGHARLALTGSSVRRRGRGKKGAVGVGLGWVGLKVDEGGEGVDVDVKVKEVGFTYCWKRWRKSSMGRYRRVPIAMVLSLFVRPSIHVTNPLYVSIMDGFAGRVVGVEGVEWWFWGEIWRG